MHLDNLINKIEFTSKNIITKNKNQLQQLKNSFILKNPNEIIKRKKESYYRNIDKLEVLNPLLTLKRGYTMTKSGDKVISSAKEVSSGDELDIEFDDGTVNTKVI
jgi:exodeoxyribonuclease VII large subunit